MYQNFEQLLSLCSEKKEALWRIILENECAVQNTTENAVFTELDKRFTVMEESAAKALDKPLATAGNLISGYACRHNAYNKKTPGLCGTFINRVIALALSVSEVNASMGRICAAPTAGASGIIPAGIGAVIVKNATVSGAEGGCQAECASAAGMASAAAVEFAGGTPAQSLDAFCFCLMNAMGLICDPVAGLVQVPCAQRNASQAVNALLSADMALAGMTSPIPADEVLEAMYRVGKMLPFELKETARGGIAATKTGKLLRKTLLNG